MGSFRKRQAFSSSWIAPPGLSLISFLLCIGAELIPTYYYTSLMREPDLMFMNFDVIFFFMVYWAIFLIGYYQGSRIHLTPSLLVPREAQFTRFGIAVLFGLLGGELVIFLISFHILYHRVPDIFSNFFTDNVEKTKEEIMLQGAAGALTAIVLVAIGTVWWLVFRWEKISRSMSKLTRITMFYPAAAAIAFAILAYSSLMGSRFENMPLIFGLMIIFYVKRKDVHGYLKARDKLLMLLFPLALVGFFIFFSVLRGAVGETGIMYTLVGYGPASYNRLAAILNGSLDYNGQHGWLNEFEFLFDFPLELRFIPIDQILHLPVINEILIYSKQVGSANLSPYFIWATLFGQLYADLGILSFPYMLGYGVVAGFLWNMFQRRRAFGVILYPYMAFSILLWIGFGIFAYGELSALIFTAIIFAIFERSFVTKVADRAPVVYG